MRMSMASNHKTAQEPPAVPGKLASWWRRIDWIWLALVGGSVLTAWLGEHPQTEGLGQMVIGAVLILSAAKGLLIALSYMELLHAPAIWRNLVVGWLALVLGAIAAISLWP